LHALCDFKFVRMFQTVWRPGYRGEPFLRNLFAIGETFTECAVFDSSQRVANLFKRLRFCTGRQPSQAGMLQKLQTMQPLTLSIPLSHQLGSLLLIGLAVACVSWTVTHEEVFREPREFCRERSKDCRRGYERKFFYLFTCEYCFSHYVAAFFLVLTRFQLLYAGWRGYVLAEFALVWVANFYMGVFNRLRLDIKFENLTIEEQAKASRTPGPKILAK
jgi:hypothetical protein